MDVKINLILSLLIFCIFANSNSLPQRSQISSNPEILTKVQGLINQVRNLHNNVNKVKCQNAGRKLNALGSKAYDVFLCFGDLFLTYFFIKINKFVHFWIFLCLFQGCRSLLDTRIVNSIIVSRIFFQSTLYECLFLRLLNYEWNSNAWNIINYWLYIKFGKPVLQCFRKT